MYEEGLARFATSEYTPPIGSNLSNLYMHLTNYAINKESDNFKQNEGNDDDDTSAHKRPLSSIFKQIDEDRKSNPDMISSDDCWQQIKELTVKTIISCHQSIAHTYRTTKP
jgi:tubulin polyglutamylase TTLL6/13